MEKKLFSCEDVFITHEHLLKLRESGHLLLGIDERVAEQVVEARQVAPNNRAVLYAYYFWNFVAFLVFAYTVYLSFTKSWWWFIVGAVVMTWVYRANQKGNSENLLDAAMYEAEFYERVQAFGGWIYRIDESVVDQYRNQ